MIDARVFTGGGFGENAYLAIAGGECLVIDPGAAVDAMLTTLDDEGLAVAAVVLTHAHLDHVEGLARLSERVDAPIHLHPDDLPLLRAAPDQAEAFGVRVDAPPEPDRTLSHGDRIAFGDASVEVRHAPGHSPGHVILYSEEEPLAFVGDVVFAGSIGRTDLPGGNYRVLMESIREQVLTLPDETRLLTGHGPETTVERERTGNPFLVPHYGGELA